MSEEFSELLSKLKDAFPDSFENEQDFEEEHVVIDVKKEKLRDLATFMKHDLGFTLDIMAFGTDYEDKMEMRWYLGRPDKMEIIILKVTTDRENPSVPTLSDIWFGFNWHERETYDLLGVNFEGHNDLRRIYLPDNWEGYPLREDYIYKKPKYHKPEGDRKDYARQN